jgi:hypothetical protein
LISRAPSLAHCGRDGVGGARQATAFDLCVLCTTTTYYFLYTSRSSFHIKRGGRKQVPHQQSSQIDGQIPSSPSASSKTCQVDIFFNRKSASKSPTRRQAPNVGIVPSRETSRLQERPGRRQSDTAANRLTGQQERNGFRTLPVLSAGTLEALLARTIPESEDIPRPPALGLYRVPAAVTTPAATAPVDFYAAGRVCASRGQQWCRSRIRKRGWLRGRRLRYELGRQARLRGRRQLSGASATGCYCHVDSGEEE